MQHWKIKIEGRVQGVYYRASTQQQAKAIGVSGFVQNMPDGSVYAEAEGNEDQLNTLLTWCKRGPMLANVSNISYEVGEIQHFEGFEVRR